MTGAGFEAYEGVMAVESVHAAQTCNYSGSVKSRIENGRFELALNTEGSVYAFLDMNDDGQYQKNEPLSDWRPFLTPAEFDAYRVLQFEVRAIPEEHKSKIVNVVICSQPDVLANLDDYTVCNTPWSGSTVNGILTVEFNRPQKAMWWAVWLADPNLPSLPLQPDWPRFIGELSKLTCTPDGDLTLCSLSIADSLQDGGIGDAGFDVADAEIDAADAAVDIDIDSPVFTR